jgi:hypothetical protein
MLPGLMPRNLQLDNEPTQCRNCGYLIHFSENKISQTGKMIPINFTDNKFGKRGENHNCRPQYKAIDPKTIDMYVFCPSCLTNYDRRETPWCPCCFKLKCLKCNGLWIATTHNMIGIDPEGEIIRECVYCGSMDYEMIEDVESWRKAWDERAEMVGLLKCPRCKGKNWIGPAPLVYHRSTSSSAVSFVPNLPYRDWWKD